MKKISISDQHKPQTALPLSVQYYNGETISQTLNVVILADVPFCKVQDAWNLPLQIKVHSQIL